MKIVVFCFEFHSYFVLKGPKPKPQVIAWTTVAGIVLGRDIEIFSHIFPKNPIAILKWLIFTIGISSEYVLS